MADMDMRLAVPDEPLAGETRARADRGAPVDYPLIVAIAALALIGLVMVASASIAMAERYGEPLALFQRQLVYMGIAAVGAAVVFRIPLEHWQAASRMFLAFGYFLLVIVLIPGVGHEVNGATRWLDLGIIQPQVSELARLAVILYLADYLARRSELVRQRARGFWIPAGILISGSLLMLAEPDFGGAAVLMATGLIVLFLAGVALSRFVALLAPVGAGVVALVVVSPYRLERITGFLDPWADPLDSGFQLTQALIAIGRGGWFGVGLGESVQKLFYLPEAHTDFLFAVLAEELGLMGVTTVLALYGFVVYRGMRIGAASHRAGRPFGGYLAWGVAAWLGLQTFVNIGVNLGVLPTKGLTLPLMSYGGSSLVTTLAALALLLRVDAELRKDMGAPERGGEHDG
jgi:cell division protein FtsW